MLLLYKSGSGAFNLTPGDQEVLKGPLRVLSAFFWCPSQYLCVLWRSLLAFSNRRNLRQLHRARGHGNVRLVPWLQLRLCATRRRYVKGCVSFAAFLSRFHPYI
jgi:hypothetical protein